MSKVETVKRGVGLVLSGGGGKGAYEIGVWKALDEYGVSPGVQAISGTSVGALNAALFAQKNLEQALRVWSTISPEAVMTLNRSSAYQNLATVISQLLDGTMAFEVAQSVHGWITKRFADQGVLSKEGLSRLIDGVIDPERIITFPGPIYVAAYNCFSRKVNYFDLKECTTLEEMKVRLLASASIPVVFGKTYVDGKLYWDGGLPFIGDNTPVKPLYNDGFRNLIVVHLSREEPVDRTVFPDCNIIEIMPQQDLGGVVSGTMNFEAERAAENIQRGYRDAVRVLEPIFKTGVALNRIQRAFQEMSREQAQFAEQNRLLDQRYARSGAEIDALLAHLDKGGNV